MLIGLELPLKKLIPNLQQIAILYTEIHIRWGYYCLLEQDCFRNHRPQKSKSSDQNVFSAN